MAIIQCSNGHYYDNNKFMECPHCKGSNGNARGYMEEESVTVRLKENQVDDEIVHYIKQQRLNYEVDVDNEKTVAIFSKDKGNDFVTGWLVCVKGPEKGRDYHLHYGFNKVGRSRTMDISIEEDRQISREEHCAIVYEYKKNLFYIVPHGGNFVYINGEFVEKQKELTTGDVIAMGGSEFEFVAFCRGERKWEKE